MHDSALALKQLEEMDRLFMLTQTKSWEILEIRNRRMEDWDYKKHMGSLCDWNNKFALEY